MKIGLVHAPNSTFTSSQNFGLKFSPVWAYVLVPYLHEYGHEAELFDLTIIQKDQITLCDIYFLSGINQDLESIQNVSEHLRFKFPLVSQFLGGPIAWSFDQANELEKLKFVDTVCIGDGELLLEKIFSSISLDIKLPKVIRTNERFDLSFAKPMDLNLINSTSNYYYGAVIEVSRGCPFLCEFCDIRVIKDNNKTRVKDISVILKELNYYRINGIKNIQFACDNFIGDLSWAKKLVNEIIEFNKIHNWTPSFYTWLTINISFHDMLMRDMRVAGFDNLFIGVESFENNTLLETAKLQNSKVKIEDELKKIQSYGFIVVAGLIFGFDSDTEKSIDYTLWGIQEAGLISGDASLLTALPGTPLYRRMKLSNRLREFKSDSFLGGHKYVTNIKYLLDKKIVINNYIKFSKNFTSGEYQYGRLKRFYHLLSSSENYIRTRSNGYTDPFSLMKKMLIEPRIFLYYIKIMVPILFTNEIKYLLKGSYIALKYRFSRKIDLKYFIFWLFIWVNGINKYGKISENDFDIDSVPKNYDYRNLIPNGYSENATEDIPRNKINAQIKATTMQLERIINIYISKN